MSERKWFEIPKQMEEWLKQEFEKKWYDWEKVKKALEQVRIEEVNLKLDELEARTTEWVERAYKGIKEILQKHNLLDSTKKENSEVKTITEETLKETWVNKSSEKIREVTWKIPLIWGWLAEMWKEFLEDSIKPVNNSNLESSITSKISKWFYGIVFWFLWVKSLDSYLEENKEKIWQVFGNVSENVSEKLENISEKVSEKVLEEKPKEKQEKVLENIENSDLRYYGSFKMLIELWWESYNKNVSVKEYTKIFKDITYENFLNNKDNLNFFNVPENLKEYLPWILNSFSSKKVQDLLRIWLKKDSLEKILMWKNLNTPNEKVKKFLWEKRFDEILAMLKSNNFDYKKLTVWELSYLYSFTVPVLFWWALSYSSEVIWNYLPDSISSEISKLKELENKDFFTEELIAKISTWWIENTNNSKENLLKNFSTEKDKQDFEKLFEFKNYVIWEFLNEKALALNEEEKAVIRKELKYRHIAILYSITWWEKISFINEANLPLILWTIVEIMKTNNASNVNLASNYLNRYLKEFALTDTNFLTEDQKTVIEIFGKKIIFMFTNNYRNKLAETLGFAWINQEKALLLSAVTWVSAVWLHKWTKWMINKGIQRWAHSFLWHFLRKWVWPLWIASVALWWASFVLDENSEQENNFQKELKDSYEKWDLRKYMELVKKFENSISLEQINIDWKTEEVWLISLPWESPLIIRWDEVFTIGIYPGLGKKIWEDITFWGYEVDAKIDWKNVYPITISWEKIIFWETGYELNLEQSLMNMETVKSWVSALAEFWNNALEQFWWKRKISEWYWNYIKLWEVWEFWIWLIPLFKKE